MQAAEESKPSIAGTQVSSLTTSTTENPAQQAATIRDEAESRLKRIDRNVQNTAVRGARGGGVFRIVFVNACAAKDRAVSVCRFRLPFAAVIPARASFDAGRKLRFRCDR
jgi:hypothetical protein